MSVENINLKLFIILKQKSDPHHDFVLEDVFGSSIRVLDFFAEKQVQLEQEEMALSSFANQLPWIPHLVNFASVRTIFIFPSQNSLLGRYLAE